MRVLATIGIFLMLASCDAPELTSSGVGFDSYDRYSRARAEREAILSGQTASVVPGPTISDETIGDTTAPAMPRRTRVAAADPASVPDGAPMVAAGTEIAVDTNNPGISNNQDFESVTERVSIEADRERLQALRDSYEVVRPTAVPRRPGDTGPNIVEYALSTTNRVGQPIYRRAPMPVSQYRRNCARYDSPDQAQQAFLDRGGPREDRLGIDPDGDGFACGWNPEPFRKARRG